MESKSVQNTTQDTTQEKSTVPVVVDSVQCVDPKPKKVTETKIERKNHEKSKKLKKKIEVCEIKIIEEISEDKQGSMKNIAKTIFLSATIIFLLFAIASTSLLLANKDLRDSLSKMVWGRNIHLQEIDVFSTKKHKNPIVGQSQLNQLKILRTVADSDNHRNHEAIAFGPDMSHIPLNGFKNSDYQLLPQRFKDDCVGGESCGLNSKHYDYVITPNTDKCKTASVLVTIKSAADHFEHRAAIRESWASVAQNETLIVFLLGRPAGTQESNSDETMVKIISEAENYSDILLGDYTDTYANLTLKALSGLKWRNEDCSEPEYSLSIDDDTFVDLENLIFKHLNRLPVDSDYIECSERTVVNGKVWREGRWAVSPEVYDSEKYPNYCNGPCYLMPKSASKTLYEMSQSTKTDLQADDALFTGVFRSKAKIPLIQYTRTKSPGWCVELNNRKPRLPKRMIKEFERLQEYKRTNKVE